MGQHVKKLCRRLSRQCTEAVVHLNLAREHSSEFVFDPSAVVDFAYLRRKLSLAEESVRMAHDHLKQFLLEYCGDEVTTPEGGAR